ncbi:hypothetical protein CPB84DRAFT_857240 [Gymnopilus junonius]|uniref:Uncharacterized protein n=1 Tax=Gymnopilus junonius TaxID=109634 RepID=A0A9P5NSF9_GYMJU|nr:hypothetical protein CPB84DRAFT_857240 [Gymnopilus junonius]
MPIGSMVDKIDHYEIPWVHSILSLSTPTFTPHHNTHPKFVRNEVKNMLPPRSYYISPSSAINSTTYNHQRPNYRSKIVAPKSLRSSVNDIEAKSKPDCPQSVQSSLYDLTVRVLHTSQSRHQHRCLLWFRSLMVPGGAKNKAEWIGYRTYIH